MFKKDDYGKPINERLSQTIRRNTSKNVAAYTTVSFSTIRDVVYRTNSLDRKSVV